MNSETPLTDAVILEHKYSPFCGAPVMSIVPANKMRALELRCKRLEEALRRVTHDVEELFKLADDCIIYDGDTWSCRSCGMELDSGIGHSSHCLASRITDFGAAIHVAEKALIDQQEEKPIDRKEGV